MLISRRIRSIGFFVTLMLANAFVGAGRAGSPIAAQSRDAAARDIVTERLDPGRVTQPDTHRKALVIGNDTYESARRLTNARNDARAIASLLEGLGFQVHRVEDADARFLDSSISNFVGSLGSNDLVFFFYAGHGVQIDQVNYMVPIDFHGRTEVDAKHACYSVERLQEHVERSGARLNVLVFDACRNNPLDRSRSLARGLAPMDVRLGTLVAFAAGPGQTADDNPGQSNGLFTKHLLTALRQPVSLVSAFREARELVYRESSGAQRPWIHEDVIGEVFLAELRREPAHSASPVRQSTSRDAGEDLKAKGQRLYNQGDFSGAATAFDLARRSNAEDAFAHNAAGAAYSQLNLLAQAIESFNRAIRLRPDYVAAYYNRGMAFLRQARYRQAIPDFTWAIEEDQSNPVLHAVRGRAYFAVRDYEVALDDLTRSIDLNPSDPYPYHLRGQILHRLGKLERALDDFTQAILRQPSFREAYEDRARTRQELGDENGATQDRRIADRMTPREGITR